MKTVMLVSAWMVLGATAARAQEVPAGRLGHPLGSYLTIAGVRGEGFKFTDRTLLVDVVNGRQLEEPIAVRIENVGALPAGRRCVFRGYENGKMIGTPPAVEQAAKEAGREISVPQARWQLYRYFTVLSVVEPKDFQQRAMLAPVVTPRPLAPAQHARNPQARNPEDPGPAGRDPSIAWNMAAGFMAEQGFAGKYSKRASRVAPVAGVPGSYDVSFKPLDPNKASHDGVVRVDIKKRACIWLGERNRGAATTAQPGAAPLRGG